MHRSPVDVWSQAWNDAIDWQQKQYFLFFPLFSTEEHQQAISNKIKIFDDGLEENCNQNELGLLPKFIPRPHNCLEFQSREDSQQLQTKENRRKYLINLMWPDYLKLSRGQEGYRICGWVGEYLSTQHLDKFLNG